MKSTFLTVFGLAAGAIAQSSDDLPQCGRTCASNMISAEKSQELGCSTGDLGCLCTNPDFLYGLRDCSNAICNSEQSELVVSYGLEICRQNGVQITTGSAGSVSASATGTEAVRTVLSTFTSGDSTITSALSTISGTATDGEGDATVSTYTSTLTDSAGEEFTTTGEAIFGGVRLTTFTSGGSEIISTITETSGASETSDAGDVVTYTTDGTQVVSTRVTVTSSVGTESTDTATTSDETESAEVTTFTTDGTEVIRTLTTQTVSTGSESVSETVTDAETATETGEGAEATTTGEDNAAMARATGAPVGVIAAAGLAMLLL